MNNKSHTFKSIIKIVKIEFMALKSNPQIIYSQMLLPVMYFIFFLLPLNGLISSVSYNQHTFEYKLYVLPGIFSVIFFKEMFTCVYRVIIDRRNGLLRYKLNSQIPLNIYAIGMAFIPIVGTLIQILMIIILLYLISGVVFKLHILIMILLLSVVFEFFWCSIGIIIAIITKDYKTRDFILQTLLVPVMYSAPIFSVIDKSPKFVQIISVINPLTYQANSIRDLIIENHQLMNMIISIILTIFVSFLLLKVLKKSNISNEIL